MLIQRKLFNELKEHLSAKEISIIIGPRQIGKTTLMHKLFNDLKEEGKEVIFLNLDVEAESRFFSSQELLLSKIKLEIGESGYVFIDEIQRKENAGLFLKGIYDLNLPYKFIISGSGSLELKEKIHESLTGRKRLFELLPVTFEEFVNFKTGYNYTNKLDALFELEKEKIEIFLTQYLSFGGYPRIVVEDSLEEKKKLLDEIFRSYIEKDIVYLLNVERPDAFTLLVKILSSQVGRLINYSQLSLDVGISVNTLKKYLWYAEKTYIVKTLTPFFSNKKKELTKSRTTYFYDLGLRNYANGFFDVLNNQNELGFLFQNLIGNLLEDQLKWKSDNLNFWRTTDRAEVDFIVRIANNVIPIEVKYTTIKKTTIKRSLRNFIAKYAPQKAYIVNRSYSKIIKINNTSVEFIPYYKLLGNSFL